MNWSQLESDKIIYARNKFKNILNIIDDSGEPDSVKLKELGYEYIPLVLPLEQSVEEFIANHFNSFATTPAWQIAGYVLCEESENKDVDAYESKYIDLGDIEFGPRDLTAYWRIVSNDKLDCILFLYPDDYAIICLRNDAGTDLINSKQKMYDKFKTNANQPGLEWLFGVLDRYPYVKS